MSLHRTGPRQAQTRRAAAQLTGLLLVGSLALTGCGGDEEPEEPDASSTQEADAPALSPLTGRQVSGGLPEHPVVVVKIDNSAASRPQLGLGAADLVTEELVEGGITRLAVFFYEDIPDVVGPVRSMRATDIGIVQPAEAVLVASGGAPQTQARLKDAGITTYTEGGPGFYRDSGRSAPYNLMNRLPELVKKLDDADPPPAYLPFGKAADFPKGTPAAGLVASFSAGSSTQFSYAGDHYANTNSNAGAADQFEPETVLVLRVRVGDAGYLDPAGNPVPETKLTGTGAAMVFHGGRLVRGTWSKDGYDAPIGLKAGGKPLTIPPGKTWIELVPAKGGDVTVQR
jgi:hypothetical protein